MPSGHGGSSGGHFGGGSFGGSRSSSHSGGHFAGSRSGSHSSSYGHSHSHGYVPANTWHGWRHPHVTVFCGRQVYLDAGRAGATSVLTIFLILSIIVSIFVGIGWSDANEKLAIIKDDYSMYQGLIENAEINPDYKIEGTVTDYEEYDTSGKYCIFYEFTGNGMTVEGWSFYVYSYDDVLTLLNTRTVDLALDTKFDHIISNTDSVPMDFKNAKMAEDAEYVDYSGRLMVLRNFTFVALGVTAVLALIMILIPLTAKKPTAEQLAESKNADNTTVANGIDTSANTTSTTKSTWRCVYCNTLNDSSKNSCDGCGAKRQN